MGPTVRAVDLSNIFEKFVTDGSKSGTNADIRRRLAALLPKLQTTPGELAFLGKPNTETEVFRYSISLGRVVDITGYAGRFLEATVATLERIFADAFGRGLPFLDLRVAGERHRVFFLPPPRSRGRRCRAWTAPA